MNQALELPKLNLDAEQALPLITNLLSGLGFQVLPSFDLQAARTSQIRCKCPHHGTEQCDCQMVVLLIYGQGNQPTSMVVHAHDGKTYLSIVDNPQQRLDWSIFSRIRKAISANIYAIS